MCTANNPCIEFSTVSCPRRIVVQFSNTGKHIGLICLASYSLGVDNMLQRRNLYSFKGVQHSTMHDFIYNRSDTSCVYFSMK